MRPEVTRRNLVIQMDPDALNALVGQRFTVGSVLMEGIELCTPCVRPPTYLGRPKDSSTFVKGYLQTGGLRARIVNGCTLRRGDGVRTAPPEPTR